MNDGGFFEPSPLRIQPNQQAIHHSRHPAEASLARRMVNLRLSTVKIQFCYRVGLSSPGPGAAWFRLPRFPSGYAGASTIKDAIGK